ncbi:MAG: retropepsin-like aspartic protease [Chitinophagales bacterium]|nr:retroviral-like aspartic protease family protein [Chitinophagales bacterium]MDW8393767.1 retropepsin-like aspartic protease [Chitinophagales bacterium]
MSRKVRIPLEICPLADEGYHLFIHAAIRNQPLRLLVDTGASRTVLGRSVIQEKFPDLTILESEGLATGAGSSDLPAGLVQIPTFTLGDLELSDFSVAVLDMHHVNSAYEQTGLPGIDGVLGCDLLFAYRAVISLKRSELRLTRPRKRKSVTG